MCFNRCDTLLYITQYLTRWDVCTRGNHCAINDAIFTGPSITIAYHAIHFNLNLIICHNKTIRRIYVGLIAQSETKASMSSCSCSVVYSLWNFAQRCTFLKGFGSWKYTICGAVCFQFTHFPCDNWENIYTLSYYHHHQIGIMNYYPLFRVRSWNNGVRCMSFYILMVVLEVILRDWKLK